METMKKNNLIRYMDTVKFAGFDGFASKMPLSEVFTERKGLYLNEFSLFIAHFNTIPNFIHELYIDCKKANSCFAQYYALEIKNMYFSKRYFNRSKKAEIDDIFYFLYEDLIVDFDTNNAIVSFLFNKTELSKVEEIKAAIQKFTKKNQKSKPEILWLVNGSLGIEIKSMKITNPKLNIEDNYNEDFKEIHTTNLKRLSKKNDKGLVLLHGKPGTGKTSYIRYLISFTRKNVIFLPPNMANTITNPSLVSVLIENAEEIVIDRENDGNTSVSALLNISDGILGGLLKCSNNLFF